MKIKEAVSQIGFRFSGALKKSRELKKDPVLYLNQKDIQAIKRIGEYVEQKEVEQFHDHELFAKLFIFTYKRIFEIEGGNIMDNGMTAKRRKIYRLLNKPTYQLVQEFTDMLNQSEQYEFIEEVQVDIRHPLLISDEQRRNNLKKVEEACMKPENKKRLLGKVWSNDFVKECIEAEVNQAINHFSDSKK